MNISNTKVDIPYTEGVAMQGVLKTYDLYANSYVLKPTDLDSFSDVVSAVKKFWFSSVVLPPVL